MIKHISKLIFMLAMYELGKWIGRELYYKLTANDDVEVPSDYAINTDKQDINEVNC
ncbi:regulator [Staphylococcus epidermidis]|nr:regulator [Staphylococcus epidermidis]